MSSKQLVLIVFIAVIGAGLGLWLGQTQNSPKQGLTRIEGQPELGGPFTLQSKDGPVSLADLRGKVVAVYFGYTYCPDICPTSLQALADAVAMLPPEQQQQVQGVFISVDPERDTPDRAGMYAAAFNKHFMGLSDTPEAIAKVAKQYGAIYAKVEMPDSAMGYAVDHSSRIYVMDREGHFSSLVEHSDTPESILAELNKALVK